MSLLPRNSSSHLLDPTILKRFLIFSPLKKMSRTTLVESSKWRSISTNFFFLQKRNKQKKNNNFVCFCDLIYDGQPISRERQSERYCVWVFKYLGRSSSILLCECGSRFFFFNCFWSQWKTSCVSILHPIFIYIIYIYIYIKIKISNSVSIVCVKSNFRGIFFFGWLREG
jgi:hypothetical protein